MNHSKSNIRTKADTNIAFIFVVFPWITETFILREILQLQKLGVHPEIFSLQSPPANRIIHPEAASLAKQTHYSPFFFSWHLWSSHLYYLRHCPVRYLGLLARLISGSVKQPVLLAKTLAIFPKCVNFARIAQKLKIQHIHSVYAAHSATCAMIMAELTEIPCSTSSDQYDLVVETALHPQKLSKAQFVRTISNFNVKLIENRYGKDIRYKTHVIYRGIDLQRYRSRQNSFGAKTDSTFNILCVAALEPKKGHCFLLEAVKCLKEQGRNIKCILVGDGPSRNRLHKQILGLKITDEVIMVGDQTQKEVLTWLHKSNCFVLPSIIAAGERMEGIPNALMEAMACELPVVSTTISGIPELVEDRKNGLLVPPEDVDHLAQAISYLQDNPILAKKLGKTAREKVVLSFNTEKNVGKLLHLLLKAIDNGVGAE